MDGVGDYYEREANTGTSDRDVCGRLAYTVCPLGRLLSLEQPSWNYLINSLCT